jgi:hypothetical protein
VGFPMAAGCVIAHPHAAKTASIPAQQIGRDAAFIQKDVVPRVTGMAVALRSSPTRHWFLSRYAHLLDVGAVA